MTATLAPATTDTPVLNINSRSFAALLATTDAKIVVVDFWAAWCAPCKQLAPEFEKVAQEYAGKPVVFAKFDTETDLSITNTYGILALPTVLFLEPRTGNVLFNGELRGRANGTLIRRKLAALLGE